MEQIGTTEKAAWKLPSVLDHILLSEQLVLDIPPAFKGLAEGDFVSVL